MECTSLMYHPVFALHYKILGNKIILTVVNHVFEVSTLPRCSFQDFVFDLKTQHLIIHEFLVILENLHNISS